MKKWQKNKVTDKISKSIELIFENKTILNSILLNFIFRT